MTEAFWIAILELKAHEDTDQNKLIDQLQEELKWYRDDNDKCIDKLEVRVESLTEENRGYRAFIGVQRSHMAEHKIPLPPWPDDLPRQVAYLVRQKMGFKLVGEGHSSLSKETIQLEDSATWRVCKLEFELASFASARQVALIVSV